MTILAHPAVLFSILGLIGLTVLAVMYGLAALLLRTRWFK